MNPLSQWLVIAVVMVIAMALAWTWQRRRANAGIVDVVWAAGMGASALLVAATGQGDLAPRASLAVMAGVWSLRLAWHLWRRVRQGVTGATARCANTGRAIRASSSACSCSRPAW